MMEGIQSARRTEQSSNVDIFQHGIIALRERREVKKRREKPLLHVLSMSLSFEFKQYKRT
jgi:hypothetical protein